MIRISYDEKAREMIVEMKDVVEETEAARAYMAIMNGLALEIRWIFGREAMERTLSLAANMDRAAVIGFMASEAE